jgi:hypothetical protein
VGGRVIGSAGVTDRLDGSVLSHGGIFAPVTAAALAAAVAPGDVLCTGPVRELAAGHSGVDFVSHGSLDAYPVDRPVTVFRLAEVAEAAWAPTPLVGRDRERAELRQLLRRALLGRGELVLLTGEAGVGKTYLADDLVTEARAFGAQVLTGRCQQDATLPYLPFVEMLDALLPEVQAPEQARQILAEDAPQLAKIMPRLRTLLPNIPAALDLPPIRSAATSSRPCMPSWPGWPRSARSSWSSRTCTGLTTPPSSCFATWPSGRRRCRRW